METYIARAENTSTIKTARQALYRTALAATILGTLYLLGLIGKLVVNSSVHAVSGQGVQLVSAAVAIAWDVVLLVLFTALRRAYPSERPLFAELALLFMLLVCATSTINWFIQIAVLPRLAPNDGARLLLDVHNELSISYALEHLGWGLFFGLAALFAAAAMPAEHLEAWIRRLLIGSGALSLLHFLGVIISSRILGDMGYIAWGVLLPAATALLAARSRKTA